MQPISAVESLVAQNLTELESANADLKGFTISKVVEIPSSDKKEKKSLIVFLPHHHLKALQANYKKLALELEKRLKTVVLLVATRTIESRWIKFRKSQKRPNSRTLSSVYDSILDDLVLPGVIIGKNTRVRLDGTRYTKITLDRADEPFLRDRVNAIRAAYKLLTTR
jgi:small subunit ribosomal protein S7e